MRLRVLLTSLVLSANQTVDVDTLAEQLWPEQLPERPRRSLHTYVGRLRKLLGSDMIHTQPGVGYQLSIPPDAVDIHRFRDLLRRAAEAGTVDEELALLRLARRRYFSRSASIAR
jgi:DNA-binding SARP family transcriptional activator